jgi:hypothetical protein
VTFYLGTHLVNWLWMEDEFFPGHAAFGDVCLFVSANRLDDRTSRFPEARCRYSIDSGGFTHIAQYGRWVYGPRTYVGRLRRWIDQLGEPDWCAPQDWMCEPVMLAKTGKTVREHQKLTTANLIELRTLAPDIGFIPVLQGWSADDYLRHAEDYGRAGIDLAAEPVVGVGSVCRRQKTAEVEGLMRTLRGMGISPHGFGFKIEGLRRCADVLESADSMAWSMTARRGKPLPYCRHPNCANCPLYARKWYEEKILPAIQGCRSETAPE